MNSTILIFLGLIGYASCGFSMTADFITGFETGIFMRNNPESLNQYDCPEPKLDDKRFEQLQ